MGLLSRKNKDSSKRKDRERSVALDAETVEEVERLVPAASEPAESEYESRHSRPINADPINAQAGGSDGADSGIPAESQPATPGREATAESQPAGSGREAEQPAVDETSNPDLSQSVPDLSEADPEVARPERDPEVARPESDPEADSNPEDDATEPEPEPARMHAMDLIAPSRNPIPGFPHAKPGDSDPGSESAQPQAPVKEAHVISFANQKGGVAKTTTTLNLAVAFAESGHSVLCVDLDPQGNLTMSQGVDPDKVETSMYDVLVHDVPIIDVIVEREIDIAVASIDLAGAEIAMSTKIGRERSLEKALAEVKPYYDFICIDTPPSLGLLTINALTASDKVIVPVQCEYLSMRGLVQLQNTLRMIQENLNPEVQIEGILPTMLDARTVHAKEAIEILEENFGDLVFKSRIRKAIKFAEAPVRGSSVLKYDPQGNAANCYRELAKEVLTHGSA